MSETEKCEVDALNQALEGLTQYPTTKLVNNISAVTTDVIKHGATVITNHKTPTMVLLSVERYIELEQASKPDISALTQEFDDMYARMQQPGAAESTLSALDLDI